MTNLITSRMARCRRTNCDCLYVPRQPGSPVTEEGHGLHELVADQILQSTLLLCLSEAEVNQLVSLAS